MPSKIFLRVPDLSCHAYHKACNLIGLFDTEGRLVDLIDTYVKALPEADQRLLGEGFAIQSKLEWMAIVEDYSH